MARFDISEYQKQKPSIQLAPLVDIAFWALIFFMIIAVFSQIESEIELNLPKSTSTSASAHNAGKIVVNITQDGRFIVNQQQMDPAGLEMMLKKVAKLFSNPQVIIRADAMTYHKFVVQALDACMRSNITDVSFSTTNDETR